jgi:hypothetical protein
VSGPETAAQRGARAMGRLRRCVGDDAGAVAEAEARTLANLEHVNPVIAGAVAAILAHAAEQLEAIAEGGS